MEQLIPMYIYVRGRQLEGTYNNNPSIGLWPITAFRVMRGWGVPTEEQWPYVGDVHLWPPKEEPHDIDQLAKENKIFAYQRVKSIKEAKIVLANYNLPTIAVKTTEAWFKAVDGVIPMPSQNEKFLYNHSVALVGYDDAQKNFKFQNSWGTQWGDNGYGYLPYDYFRKYMIEAWTKISIKPNNVLTEVPGEIEARWGLLTCLNILHGIEILDRNTRDSKAWAFAVDYDKYLNVEELFVMPKSRNKGLSKALFNGLLDLSGELSLPLRIWIPHADINNIDRIKLLVGQLA